MPWIPSELPSHGFRQYGSVGAFLDSLNAIAVQFASEVNGLQQPPRRCILLLRYQYLDYWTDRLRHGTACHSSSWPVTQPVLLPHPLGRSHLFFLCFSSFHFHVCAIGLVQERPGVTHIWRASTRGPLKCSQKIIYVVSVLFFIKKDFVTEKQP